MIFAVGKPGQLARMTVMVETVAIAEAQRGPGEVVVEITDTISHPENPLRISDDGESVSEEPQAE